MRGSEGRSDFAVRRRTRRRRQVLGLILDIGMNRLKRGRMRTPVVSAEQQLSAGRQEDSNVGTSSAAVTTVGRGQSFSSSCSTHVVTSLNIPSEFRRGSDETGPR